MKKYVTFLAMMLMFSTVFAQGSLIAIKGTHYSQMSAVLNLDGSASPEKIEEGRRQLAKAGLLPTTFADSKASFPELAELKHWGKLGNPSAVSLGAQLMLREITAPKYPGYSGIFTGLEAIYDYAFAANKKVEIDKAFIDLMEKVFQVKEDMRGYGIFHAEIETPSGRKYLKNVIDPDLLYEFYLKRLREKLPDYSGYAVKYLVELNRERALNDIASIILESPKAETTEVLKDIFKKTSLAASGESDALGIGVPSVLPLPENFRQYLRWLKRLSVSLTGYSFKTIVDQEKTDLEKRIREGIEFENKMKANPTTLHEANERLNSFFGGFTRCNQLIK